MRVGFFCSRLFACLFIYPGFGIRGESSVCHCLPSGARITEQGKKKQFYYPHGHGFAPHGGGGRVGVRQHFDGTFHQGNEWSQALQLTASAQTPKRSGLSRVRRAVRVSAAQGQRIPHLVSPQIVLRASDHMCSIYWVSKKILYIH